MASRLGRFELANRGTLFPDEIGELPLELQPKLLSVLQEHEFERLGSSRTLQVDVRLIAATNRNLDELIQEHKFLTDLCNRLNVFPIYIPPLREHPEDIPPLVRHYVREFGTRLRKTIDTIPPKRWTRSSNIHGWGMSANRRTCLSGLDPRARSSLEDLERRSFDAVCFNQDMTEQERTAMIGKQLEKHFVFTVAD